MKEDVKEKITSFIFLESFNSSYLTCPKTAKAFSCLTSLWCGSVSIQVCLFYTVHWRHADQSPTVTPVDFEMNLQKCRRKGHNDSKDIGTDVEHTHLYLQSKGPNSNWGLYWILAFIHGVTKEALLSLQEFYLLEVPYRLSWGHFQRGTKEKK